MEGCTMSSSTEHFSASAATEEGGAASFNLSGAGYAAPPPTPLASCPPPHGFMLAPAAPLQSTSATDDDDDQFLIPSTSTNTPSPPSKQDLDALAQYLLRQSLHSTPNLLASPSLQRKRRTPTSVAAPLNCEEALQTFTYAGGFCEESGTGIGKACQDVGAFYILVQDAEEALSMLKARHGADDESLFEGGLITLSQLLTSAAHCHQHDVLDVDSFTIDVGIDATFRDTMSRFASLLSRISKDVLRFLLQDLPIETQANIRGHSLKPLLHIHGNGKKEMNLEDDVVLTIGLYTENKYKSERSASFVARLGPLLQTWSQGKYKVPFSKSLCEKGGDGICIQFALTQHY